MTDEGTHNAGARLFGSRLAIGLAQGLALYLLYRARDSHTWPSENGLVFAPLLVVFLFAPLAALQGLGNLRTRTLLVWLGSLIPLFAGLAFFDIWHAWPVDWVSDVTRHTSEDGHRTSLIYEGGSWQPHIIPSVRLLIALALGGFISHALISGGDADRRIIASYSTHFDVAWKLGLQVALSAAFVGVFWALLFFGAALFDLIKLDFLRRLIAHEWFWIPATTLAASAAIHITDVRAGLIRGTRTLALTLLSWLLPLLTLIVAGFLIALLFTGLAPLWNTRSATMLLLVSAAALIALVNAVYQDGTSEHAVPPTLRYPATLAAVLPVPLLSLGIYALGLRVEQYGWSTDRITAAACLFVVACYAAAYVVAIFRPGPWLKSIERWNFYISLVILTVLLAIFSPLLDPMRISVASQMARLENGRITPGGFDFAALRWDGGIYGKRALEKLSKSDTSEYMRRAAGAALEMHSPYSPMIEAQPADRTKNIVVNPKGRTLPDSFLAEDWGLKPRNWPLPPCLTRQKSTCTAWLLDLNGDGVDEIVITDGYWQTTVFGFYLDKNEKWALLGSWSRADQCGGSFKLDESDQIASAPPQPQPWPDLMAKGKRLQFQPFSNSATCE